MSNAVMVPCFPSTLRLINEQRDFEETFSETLERLVNDALYRDRPSSLETQKNPPAENPLYVYLKGIQEKVNVSNLEDLTLLLLVDQQEGLLKAEVVKVIEPLVSVALNGKNFAHMIAHARNRLVERSLMIPNKPGLWKLTEAGHKSATALKQNLLKLTK